MWTHMNTFGEGKYRVWLRAEEIGSDLLLILGGGERPHIGAMVLKIPGRPAEIVTLDNHYDHVVLEPIAEAASDRYQKKVVAIGGVHVENASKDEIDLLVKNCKELIKFI